MKVIGFKAYILRIISNALSRVVFHLSAVFPNLTMQFTRKYDKCSCKWIGVTLNLYELQVAKVGIWLLLLRKDTFLINIFAFNHLISWWEYRWNYVVWRIFAVYQTHMFKSDSISRYLSMQQNIPLHFRTFRENSVIWILSWNVLSFLDIL